MKMKKREFHMSNSSAVSASGYWYPFTESTGPNRQALEEDTPFKTLVFENKSGEEYILMLDPEDLTNPTTKWTVPNGQTLTIKEEENFYFYQIVVKNNDDIETAIGELNMQVRNY